MAPAAEQIAAIRHLVKAAPHWLARAFMRVMASCSASPLAESWVLFVACPPKPWPLARFRASSLRAVHHDTLAQDIDADAVALAALRCIATA